MFLKMRSRCGGLADRLSRFLAYRRLLDILESKPLALKIETTNICNAACCFCANRRMRRKRCVLPMDVFCKVVKDYGDIGGGPISLTPVIGDVLLDPQLAERIRVMRDDPEITEISFTTNLINHDRFSDGEWSYILGQVRFVQVSLGGLDSGGYREMYGIDAFDKVHSGIRRIGRIKTENRLQTRLALAFRTTDKSVLNRSHPLLSTLVTSGWECHSVMDTFGNWAGGITGDDVPASAHMLPTPMITGCCLIPAISIAVLCDGSITGCSCMDYEGEMILGHAQDLSIKEAWQGERRRQICKSFDRKSFEPLCRNCTAYQSARALRQREYFLGCTAKKLTADYYSFFSA